MNPVIRLKKGKEKAVRQLHPWIFSGAVEQVTGNPANGDIVTVTDPAGNFLAYGMFNSQSRVAVRLLEWLPENPINEEWWRHRVRKAIAARNTLLSSGDTDTCRLIFSEADFLPGFIADKYADFISVQILSSGVDRVKDILLDELEKCLNPAGIFDKSDNGARNHEGLEPAGGRLRGAEPPAFITVKENNIAYSVNIAEGQKSGFYCDQRDNRRLVAAHAAGKKLLDCFCYSGGFTLNALQHQAAQVYSVDSSALAIETLKKNIALNRFDSARHQAIQSDVNRQLRLFKEQNEKFDIIVLDPPKYAPSRSALDKAARAYKDLNRLGMQLLNEGGLLATFSCSGAVDITTFKQILAWAALDAGKEVQFIGQFCQPEDHPVRASFPEGEYLKGLLCRVS
ncbi:class I SAM-dependent rRNA methyltransferase (plasmid) [Pedobacter sp. BS3]|uniref:class I SAM-dependent rRNA methyltransferase n=1 Tax=Pedobacter sp. BS3 TaxID=2567937 RepID=UPI0011ED4854|nr:class I SAM-dependent rRNA methyltransferase [Pedobacter sp. BS3]TZF86122.1 class I SAM-dependent rRNA methyltransferase [Pedobacter sp. BS3]